MSVCEVTGVKMYLCKCDCCKQERRVKKSLGLRPGEAMPLGWVRGEGEKVPRVVRGGRFV